VTGMVEAGAAGVRTAWRGLRGLVILGVVLVMLALNVATLTLSSLNTLVSAAISAFTALESVGDRDRRAKEAAEQALLDERAHADRAIAEADVLRAERDRLSTDLDAAERRAAAALDEADDLRREAGRLAAELDAADDAAAEALERVRGLEDEAGRLVAELDASKAEGFALAARVEAATDDVRGLRTALNAAEAAQLVEWGGEQVPVREVVQRVTGSISDRTARVAATNLGSMAGESIPFYGVAIVVAATTYELKSSCDSMREMHELEVALGVAPAEDPQVSQVCGMRVPSKAEVWQMIKDSPSTVWTAATNVIPDADDLPEPDFGGMWNSTIGWFGGWFEE